MRRSCNVVSRRLAALVGAAIVIGAFAGAPTPAHAVCITNGATVTCSGATFEQNPPEGFGDGTQSGLTINIEPGASVAGSNSGLRLDSNNTVNNFGTIEGPGGNGAIDANGDITINNAVSGSIHGGIAGINANANATIVNAGRITGGPFGIFVNQRGSITNSGYISGGNFGILLNDTGTVTNSGTIVATNAGGSAIFGAGPNNIFTFLPGSRIIGSIVLGLQDTINIRTGGDIGWLLNFGTCACPGIVGTNSTVVFAGNYGVVSGDRIATVDPTAFALADRTLTDFTAMLSSLVGNRLAAPPSPTTAFASSATVAAANDAFAHIPPLAYANEGRLAHAESYDRATGIGVWSRGFAGFRHQNADGPTLAADTTTYGGMVGLDKMFAHDLRLGAFVGAGVSHLGVDSNSQSVRTDYIFGGVYGRKTWGTRFLDVTLSAGKSSNRSERLIASNVAATGLETATGSYDGWFVSPEIAYGIVMPLRGGITVTPSAHLRYIAGHFDGYSEAGSAQTLSVAGRTAHNLEQRAQLALSRTVDAFRATLTAGALAAERLGGDTIETVLIGQNLSFAAPGRDIVEGLYGGLGFEAGIGGRASVFVETQLTLMSDRSRTGLLHGGLRAIF